MLPKAQMRVVGFRWISSRGQGACEACAALHGREFYFKPGPGQRDAADAPEPPLHPYCKCRTDDIIEYSLVASPQKEPNGSSRLQAEKTPKAIIGADHGEGGFTIAGLVFGENDRPLVSGGPGYGYYGGGYRSKGRNTYGMTEEEIAKLPEPKPIDRMDEAFQAHDYGYMQCDQDHHDLWPALKCKIHVDEILFGKLENLPGDPHEWGRRKLTDKEIEYAVKYRLFAKWYFSIWVGGKNMLRTAPEITIPVSP